MAYAIFSKGNASGLSDQETFLANAGNEKDSEVVIYCGIAHKPDDGKRAILIELGNECLGEYTGEANGEEGSNVVGFARYRNGSDAPSKLVELVKQPRTSQAAIDAARELFEAAGLDVVVSADSPGRILSRLVAPKYNAALRFLDEGLATQKDMDLTCKLGLGYPDGPIERVTRGGLDNYYEVSQVLFDAFGTAAYAPPRRALVAFNRRKTKSTT